jgi:hypothetical protein
MDFYLKAVISNIRGAPSVAGLRYAASGHSGWSLRGRQVTVMGYGRPAGVFLRYSDLQS